MAAAALILFDDDRARDWQPFTLTRPAGELLFGTRTLRGRAESALRLGCLGHLAAPHLATFDERHAPPVLALDSAPSDHPLVFLSSRAVLEMRPDPLDPGSDPELLVVGDDVVGCALPVDADPPDPAFFENPSENAPADWSVRELPGRVLSRVWELMTQNAAQVAEDLVRPRGALSADDLPDGVHMLGREPLVLGRNVQIEPGVIIDVRDGPIRLDDGSHVHALTRIRGPAYVGPDSVLLGGSFEAVSIGPVCKVHGEMEASVVLGYTNKAHDGFLGHAYLGRWVNLGALTTNSDLKNNYGPVRVQTADGIVDTGENKMGCLLGDHVKTAIGTMLNTGTIIGAGSNIFGDPPPKYVPPFQWGTGDGAATYDIDKFLQVAETVMNRRDIEFSDDQRELLRRVWRLKTERADGKSDGSDT